MITGLGSFCWVERNENGEQEFHVIKCFQVLMGTVRIGAPAAGDGEHFSLEKGCDIGQKPGYEAHCKGPTGLCPGEGRELNSCLLALCLEMFSGDRHSPDRPRLVDVVLLVL